MFLSKFRSKSFSESAQIAVIALALFAISSHLLKETRLYHPSWYEDIRSVSLLISFAACSFVAFFLRRAPKRALGRLSLSCLLCVLTSIGLIAILKVELRKPMPEEIGVLLNDIWAMLFMIITISYSLFISFLITAFAQSVYKK